VTPGSEFAPLALPGSLETPQTIPKKILDLGEQPLAAILSEQKLKSHDLVAASTEHITHKMVARGCKGRRLSRHVQTKLLRALNTASGATYAHSDLFTY
jgi:hypothetical protein